MVMPDTLATVDDLAEWLGESFDEESTEGRRAMMSLRAASALVRKESGQTWLNPDGANLVADVPEAVQMVTLYCAARVYENPNAQTRGGLDDYNEAWKVGESGAYLTATERRQLAPYRTTSIGGIGVVSTTRVEPVNTNGWVPTGTPDVVFPWY